MTSYKGDAMNTHDEATKRMRRSVLKLIGAAGAAYGLGVLPSLARAAADAGQKLKIGTIGSGRIGSTLVENLLQAGHEVVFSSRDLERDKALPAKLGARARAGTPREAAAFADVLLVAVPYS